MKKLLIFFITLYKKSLSWVMVMFFGGGCRFHPTCSEYTKEAVEKHGVVKGLAMGAKRLSRCHPFSKSNTFDPVI